MGQILDDNVEKRLFGFGDDFGGLLETLIAMASAGTLTLRIPKLEGLMRRKTDSHYHFTPEIFIQTGGYSSFYFTNEQFRLSAGEMALIPIGVPHSECAVSTGTPFRNYVIQFSGGALSWHIAEASPDHTPRGTGEHVRQTSDAMRVAGYANDIVEYFHGMNCAADVAVKGLLLALLASLRAIEDGHTSSRAGEHYKIALARHAVMRRLSDPSLNVRTIARLIGCSADYLSHIFHVQTGQTLIAFIQRQRVAQAKGLLESSAMSIKEVSLAVGYNDPGYFIRVFKRATGQTPRSHRNNSTLRTPAL